METVANAKVCAHAIQTKKRGKQYRILLICDLNCNYRGDRMLNRHALHKPNPQRSHCLRKCFANKCSVVGKIFEHHSLSTVIFRVVWPEWRGDLVTAMMDPHTVLHRSEFDWLSDNGYDWFKFWIPSYRTQLESDRTPYKWERNAERWLVQIYMIADWFRVLWALRWLVNTYIWPHIY